MITTQEITGEQELWHENYYNLSRTSSHYIVDRIYEVIHVVGVQSRHGNTPILGLLDCQLGSVAQRRTKPTM